MDTANLKAIQQVKDYNDIFGAPTCHPLVSVVNFSDMPPIRHGRYVYGVYALFLKDVDCGEMRYGRQVYDYSEGTVLAIAPGQVAGTVDDGQRHQGHGWALIFHPDLIHGTGLLRAMKDYTYFSYEANEALHLSEDERTVFMDCLHKIQAEIEGGIDRHTRRLLVANIEVLLDYLQRFYERQFDTRNRVNHDILSRFEDLLEDYYAPGHSNELPTVKYFADRLCLSSNYFGDLVKQATGRTARDHIQQKLVDIAKERILLPKSTISGVAYELGFQYPQHFTRLFKKVTNLTPQQFRRLY